jgi:hypothetical protein
VTDSTQALDGAPAPIPAPESNSLSDIARHLADYRRKQSGESTPEIPAEQPDLPEVESPPLQAEQPEAEISEEPEVVEPAEPAIDPPRSWTKEAKDKWASLPRETQEYLAQRESERDRGLSRSQQELAEQRKAAAAEREAAEKARTQYESQLPALMQALHDANAGAFGDVKTVDDVTRLASEDPFRYLQWQAHQSKMAAVQAELDASQRRAAEEKSNSWNSHVREENEKFVSSLPESDKGKLKEWMAAAPKYLEDRGFTQSELADLWNGKDKISLHDHRLQALILDGLKFRTVQQAKTSIAQKPLPPVLRPGSQAPASGNAAKIAALTKQLDNSTGLAAMRLAAQITQLKRKG